LPKEENRPPGQKVLMFMYKSISVAFMLALTATVTGCMTTASTPPAAVPTNGTLRIFEIAPAKMRCSGMMPIECLQIRRLPSTNRELFYDSIAGFEYEPGFSYVIEVIETRVNPAPADASSLAYRLRRIVSKRRVD
jgi:hypothetical protein